MTKQEQNRVQDYFNKVFVHDISDNDFKELKHVVSSWLAKKLRESVTNDFSKIKEDTKK